MSVQSIVSIDIDPIELQSIGEVLVESYFRSNLIQKKPTLKNECINQIKKNSGALFQWTVITSSLVGANLLTSYFQPFMLQNVNNNNNNNATIATATTRIKPSEMCPEQFGCDDYMCWKSCGTNIDSWCYTSSKPKNHNFQHCTYSHECSPCWDCLEPFSRRKKTIIHSLMRKKKKQSFSYLHVYCIYVFILMYAHAFTLLLVRCI